MRFNVGSFSLQVDRFLYFVGLATIGWLWIGWEAALLVALASIEW